MINIRPLIEARIKAQIPDFKEVAGASDMASLFAGRIADNGCYIIQDSERASPNTRINAVSQENTEHYAVLIVVRNVRDSRGSDAADVCHTLRAQVLTCLLGWEPDSTITPFEKVDGRLISFADGFYIWKETYKTSQLIRNF